MICANAQLDTKSNGSAFSQRCLYDAGLNYRHAWQELAFVVSILSDLDF